MDKEKLKEMLCKAIDNIPDCAAVKGCWVEHSYGAFEASVHIDISVTDPNEENQTTFCEAAHRSFYTELELIS